MTLKCSFVKSVTSLHRRRAQHEGDIFLNLAPRFARLVIDSMKTNTAFSLLAAASLALNGATFAAGAKTYQVTGTVVEMTGSKITVEKGTEKWEIDLDPTIKTTGNVKVGATVTITYVMSATKIEGGAAGGETTPTVPSPASSP
jgi:hypothetical protein